MNRNRRRRDSGTTKNLLVALEEALDEVGMHVDSLLGEWLLATDNGKYTTSVPIEKVQED